ncbi:MAG: hypothetical protein IKR64_04740 [Treponema sp.]|nr:hypothetical protein [Treponema sp.]
MITEIIIKNIFIGDIFNNPGGGTSTIININPTFIKYLRGNSKIKLFMEDIEEVYKRFKNSTVSTSMIKDFKPEVFDSLKNGHSCNATFLFSILNHVGLLKDGINGSGKKGHPFYVTIQ